MVNKPSVFARKLRAVKGVGAGAQMYLQGTSVSPPRVGS